MIIYGDNFNGVFLLLMPLYCFTGTERFLICQRLHKRKTEFVKKYGQDGFFEFGPDNFNNVQLAQALAQQGLFSERKLIYVFGIPGDSDTSNKISPGLVEEFIQKVIPILGSIDDMTFVVFISFKPDKRLTITKKILEIVGKNYEEFSSFNQKKSDQYVRDTLGSDVGQDICDYLFEATEGVVGHLVMECVKIQSFLVNGERCLTLADCQKIVFYNGKNDVFGLFDHMFSSIDNLNNAINDATIQGKNQNEYMGMILWGMRSFLLMLDCFHNNITDSKQIITQTGLHPFFVNKNLKRVQKYSQYYELFKNNFEELIQLDYDIKTGRLVDGQFWLVVKTILSKFLFLSH